ncbi:hypothetical protein TRFO_18236 [Tritrichomonas foetus]|uniref:Uncharacterized protein n=1 Tax=Tritrichomonas foetus TaxID=1144522 RepID=A0A1J4KQU8_9EUKA|nr:hypothetical protein TRFO_18236 [Tritrichomonas foetus]|eukprot:OHT12046.1 hypothetical protein TRFO_18236 [Tritrichomonas foetus]
MSFDLKNAHFLFIFIEFRNFQLENDSIFQKVYKLCDSTEKFQFLTKMNSLSFSSFMFYYIISSSNKPDIKINQYLGSRSPFVRTFKAKDINTKEDQYFIFFKTDINQSKEQFLNDLHLTNAKFAKTNGEEIDDFIDEIYLFDTQKNLVEEEAKENLELILDSLFVGGYDLFSEGPLFLIRGYTEDIKNAALFFNTVYPSLIVENTIENVPVVVIEGLTAEMEEDFKQANSEHTPQISFENLIVHENIFYGVLSNCLTLIRAIENLQKIQVNNCTLSVAQIGVPKSAPPKVPETKASKSGGNLTVGIKKLPANYPPGAMLKSARQTPHPLNIRSARKRKRSSMI